MSAHPPPPHEDDIAGRVYDARLVRRLKEYVLPETPLLLVSTVLMFVVMGAQLLQPWIMKLLIDEHLLRSDAAGVARFALLYFLSFGVELLARFGQLYTMERTGQNVIRDLRCRVFAHLQSLDSSFFDAHPVGWLMRASHRRRIARRSLCAGRRVARGRRQAGRHRLPALRLDWRRRW